MSIWSVFVLLLVSAAALAQGNDNGDQPVFKMQTTAEFLDQQERISGGATVGIVFFNPNDTVSLDDAFVYFAEPEEAVLEMHLATVDGRYLATFEYTSPPGVNDWVRLDLSLSQKAFLQNYAINEIALLMTNVDTGVAYPVRWGQKSEAEVVRVYINSEGARSFFASYDPNTGRPVARSCVEASDKSSFKFDRICDVPVEDVFDRTSIEIIRKRGAGFGTPIDITVSLPPPGASE